IPVEDVSSEAPHPRDGFHAPVRRREPELVVAVGFAPRETLCELVKLVDRLRRLMPVQSRLVEQRAVIEEPTPFENVGNAVKATFHRQLVLERLQERLAR